MFCSRELKAATPANLAAVHPRFSNLRLSRPEVTLQRWGLTVLLLRLAISALKLFATPFIFRLRSARIA